MPCLYLADTKPEDRSALCRLLLDLKKEVVGEAADWSTTLLPAGAGAFVSKGERHERVAERLRLVADSVRT